MTDGIIQKVVNKKKRDANNTSFSDHVRISMLLNELEQELIEEIKKHEVWQWHAVRIITLIGDNE